MIHPPLYVNRQAFPCVLVHDCQQSERSTIVGPLIKEIIAPDVVPMFRAQSHAGTVVQPESPSGLLFWQPFQTFPTPGSLHPILAHRPACAPQQRRDSSIAVPPGSAYPRPVDQSAGIVASPSLAPAAGRRAVLTDHTLPVPAPPHNVAAQGSEVSRGHILQDLLLQRQLRHQPLQPRVFLLQLFQPFRRIQL